MIYGALHGAPPLFIKQCLDGGIGRHEGLKIPFLRKWGFDSLSRYHKQLFKELGSTNPLLMPFFVGSTHFNVQSFGETQFFMISNQGFSFILTFQSFNIKFEPKAEKILFLVSRSQLINDCFALDENSNASKVKSKASLHLVSILSLCSFNFNIFFFFSSFSKFKLFFTN